MSKNKRRRQPAARSLKFSRPVRNCNVSLSDQETFNLFSRSVEGLTPDSQSAFVGELLRAGLELRKVTRLRYAYVMVDDSGVQPPKLDWYPDTIQSLKEVWKEGPIVRDGDSDADPRALSELEACSVLSTECDYLVACGLSGAPDGLWTIVGVKEESMLALRDGSYISVADFQANPGMYLLSSTPLTLNA